MRGRYPSVHEWRKHGGHYPGNRLETSVEAPVQQGDPVGRLVYLLNGQEIGSILVTAAKDVLRATFSDYLWMVVQRTAVL